MSFVIQYDDGAYNYGPENTDVNGFPVRLAEASQYSTLDVANEKLQDLLGMDGTGAKIIETPVENA